MRIGYGIAVLAGLAAGCGYGATYYVSVAGDDFNPGTQSSPFRHLSKGASAATQPGDTVIVMDGTYDNEGVTAPGYVVSLNYSGIPGYPITFMAQNRGQAVLDSMNASTTSVCDGASAYFNLKNAAYIVIQGFVIQRACDEGIHSNGGAHDITIRWNEIRNIANRTVTDQVGRDAIYMNAMEYNFIFDGNSFHDIGRTDGQPELHFDHGIYAHSANVTVINNIFYNMNRGWSIQLADGATNWLIANNTFAFPNANGEAGQIMFWGANSGIVVQNNIFYQPTQFAIKRYAAAISGGVFDHNLVYGPDEVLPGNTAGIAIGINQIGLDPMFVNSSSPPYDFRLQWNSPAIGAGVNLSGISNDFSGFARPAGTGTDVGAYGLEIFNLAGAAKTRGKRPRLLGFGRFLVPILPVRYLRPARKAALAGKSGQ